MTAMVGVHAVGAVLALVAGAVVLLLSKGTRAHRRWGWSYVASLVAMAVSSFGIYELRDGPSIFHLVSVLTLAVVTFGLAQPLRRHRSDWMVRHLLAMQVSYLMLVVTGIAQFFDRLPLPNDALNAIVFLQLPSIVGFVLIVRSSRRHPRDLPLASDSGPLGRR